ncbi:MAG: hypothetical protein HY336_01055 [Candidatus Doudnabacteria bacterium]|nr:hypothetical protein [Candidatus Doudnabacteria bacterium]
MTAKAFAVTDDQLLTFYDRFRELSSRVHRADRTSLLDLDRVNDSIQLIMESQFEGVRPAGEVQTEQPQPEVPTHPPVPAVGEWFELEIDGDLDIAPSGWKLLGPVFLKGKRTYRAKLVELGDQLNLKAARNAAKTKEPKCVMAPGQAREAFMAKYPRHNNRLIVLGGNEWQDFGRGRRVACLGDWSSGSAWSLVFGFSGSVFSGVCLWLVLEQVEGA